MYSAGFIFSLNLRLHGAMQEQNFLSFLTYTNPFDQPGMNDKTAHLVLFILKLQILLILIS